MKWANIELPETEDELYSRRLDLLLGQWDNAKGIPPMPKNRRDAYKLYLMELAYHMQSSNTKEIPYETAVDKSSSFTRQLRGSKYAIMIDCISRGLLFRNENGDVSFGHLTYQEHLSAMYLAKHNPVVDILDMLESIWWSKVLQFYSMQMVNIDQLIKQANKYKNLSEGKRVVLNDLINYAPYTNEKLKDKS